MEDFIKSEGLPFLAHLLRRLSDEIVAGARAWYPQVGVTAPPRAASTLRLLAQQGPKSVTEISGILQQSHPLVITWVRQLKRLGFVTTATDPKDRRRTVVRLTRTGAAEARRMKHALTVLGETCERLMTEAKADVFDSLWRLEEACTTKPFTKRLCEQAARRVKLIDHPYPSRRHRRPRE